MGLHGARSGADGFMKYASRRPSSFTVEVLPAVDCRFRVDTTSTTIFGFSFSLRNLRDVPREISGGCNNTLEKST